MFAACLNIVQAAGTGLGAVIELIIGGGVSGCCLLASGGAGGAGTGSAGCFSLAPHPVLVTVKVLTVVRAVRINIAEPARRCFGAVLGDFPSYGRA